MKVTSENWQDRASEVVGFVSKQCFEAHRGCLEVEIEGGEKLVAVFGNDGYPENKRAVAEVAHVRGFVKAAPKLAEVGFAHNGYSWALLIQAEPDPALLKALEAAAWIGWAPKCDEFFRRLQTSIAHSAIARAHGDERETVVAGCVAR